jgi:hypothetical protein
MTRPTPHRRDDEPRRPWSPPTLKRLPADETGMNGPNVGSDGSAVFAS